MRSAFVNLGPLLATSSPPRRLPGEPDAAYAARYRAWASSQGGAGLAVGLEVGLPGATLRFDATGGGAGAVLGAWPLASSSSLPAPTRGPGSFAPQVPKPQVPGPQGLPWPEGAAAPADVPSAPPYRMAGAVSAGLREPADRPPADLERERVLAATGFDVAWGTPPEVGGLAWSETRLLYEPTRDPEGLRYRQAEREGTYAQAYRLPAGLGGWALRWVRVATTLPDEARPYRPLPSGEASAVQLDVGRYALDARPGGTPSVWDRLQRGGISIDPPGTPSVRSGASNDTLSIVAPPTSPAPLEVPIHGLNGKAAIVEGARNAGAWLGGAMTPDILPLPDAASALASVRRPQVLPCQTWLTTISDPALIRLFVGDDSSEFLMTDAPSPRKGRFSRLPDEPVVLAVESRVPYSVRHTCRCGSSSCVKETSVLARTDTVWTTPHLRPGSARGARLGVHSVEDDDVHLASPRASVPGSSVLLLPPRLDVGDEANLTVWVEVTVPARRVADGPAFTARLSIRFKVRRAWNATGSSVRQADQDPSEAIMAKQDRYEYEFEASSRGDPQQVPARHLDRLSCDCTPMEPIVRTSISMQPLETPPPFAVHAGDVVRLRWAGSSSWEAELRCESEACTIPPPIGVHAEAALAFSWSAEQNLDEFAQIDRHEFMGPTTLESVLIRVPKFPGPDFAHRELWVQVVATDRHGQSRTAQLRLVVETSRRVQALLVVVHGGSARAPLSGGEMAVGRGYNPDLEALGTKVEGMLAQGAIVVTSHLRVLAQDQKTRFSASCETPPADQVARIVLEWIDRVVSERGVVGPVVMLGHSWGANAIALAARVLERIGVGIDVVFAIDRTACGGLSSVGPLGLVASGVGFQPDVGTNVMLVDNVTAGGTRVPLGYNSKVYEEVWEDRSSVVVSAVNATRYRPVWCARVSRNYVVHGVAHSSAEDDLRSVRFIVDEASRLVGDLSRRRFAVMNSRRPCAGVVEAGGRRWTAAKALLDRLEAADAHIHGTLRSCEKPAGYEGR